MHVAPYMGSKWGAQDRLLRYPKEVRHAAVPVTSVSAGRVAGETVGWVDSQRFCRTVRMVWTMASVTWL